MRKSLLLTTCMATLLGVGVFAGVSAGKEAKVEKAEAATAYNFKFHVTDATGWEHGLAVHLWDVNDSANKTTTWPGKSGVWEYSNEYNQGVYHFEFSLNFIPNKVIFNNNNNGAQTPTLDFNYASLTEHTAYVVNSSGISGTWTFEDLTREYYIYLNKTEVISSTNLHIFADNNNDNSYPVAWPGYEMTVVENTGGKVYKSPAIPCKYNRLKFTSDDYSDGHQQQANNVCEYNGQAWNSYGYNWESLLDVKVQSWIDTYMHMDSNTPGQCEGYFGPAKDNLTAEVYADLSSNDMFASAYKRYCDWAAALGRDPNPSVVDGLAMNPFEVGTTNYSIVAIIASVSAIAVGAFFFFKKKKSIK